MTPRVLLLLAAALGGCAAQGSENQASDCCLRHKNHPIPSQLLTAYRIQGPETGCRLAAVVFITKKNRSLCAPPGAPWAQGLMELLDGKKGRSPAGRAGKQPRPKGTKPRKQRKPRN